VGESDPVGSLAEPQNQRIVMPRACVLARRHRLGTAAKCNTQCAQPQSRAAASSQRSPGTQQRSWAVPTVCIQVACHVCARTGGKLRSPAVTHGQPERSPTWERAGRPAARNDLLSSGSCSSTGPRTGHMRRRRASDGGHSQSVERRSAWLASPLHGMDATTPIFQAGSPQAPEVADHGLL